MNLINVPNTITFIRALLAIPAIYFIYIGRMIPGMSLFLLFMFLDGLDGYTARKLNRLTIFGKHLDFTVDLLFGSAVVIILLIKNIIPSFYIILFLPPFVVFLAATVLSMIKAKRTVILASWKKTNAVFFVGSMFLFLINQETVELIAYLLLIYFYVAAIKYFFEILRLEKIKKV